LTPEEHLFLKNESDNPYFSFLNEEKQDKLDISFDDFLKENRRTKNNCASDCKKEILHTILDGCEFGNLNGNHRTLDVQQSENIAPQIANHNVAPKKVEARKAAPVEETQTQQPVLAQQDMHPVKQTIERRKSGKSTTKSAIRFSAAETN
jgi:hypothetical protein